MNDCRFGACLRMHFALATLARSRRDGACDHAAGDAGAGVAIGLGHVIVSACADDQRRAILVEDRFLAIAQREGSVGCTCAQHALGGRHFVGQVARMRPARRKIAVRLLRIEGEVRAGGGEAVRGAAIAGRVDVDAVRSGRQALQVILNQHAVIGCGECHGAAGATALQGNSRNRLCLRSGISLISSSKYNRRDNRVRAASPVQRRALPGTAWNQFRFRLKRF
jgi:hypothetical protein